MHFQRTGGDSPIDALLFLSMPSGFHNPPDKYPYHYLNNTNTNSTPPAERAIPILTQCLTRIMSHKICPRITPMPNYRKCGSQVRIRLRLWKVLEGCKSASPTCATLRRRVGQAKKSMGLAHSRRSRSKKGNWKCTIKGCCSTVVYST